MRIECVPNRGRNFPYCEMRNRGVIQITVQGMQDR
jgi:hypothetical protein